MLDPLCPLILPAEYQPDFSLQDWSAEIDRHWERQVLTDALLAGEIPLDELLDFLSSQGIDPDRYCERTVAQIERAIALDIAQDMDENEVLVYAR